MSQSNPIDALAQQLGETEAKPLSELQVIIGKLGMDAAGEIAAQAEEIDAGNGMMTNDGTRQRTLGGIFFKLARDRIGRTPPPPPIRRLKWPDAAQAANEAIGAEPGEASTVKLTIIGRPGKLVKRGESVVVTTMYNHKRPTLPKQLPKLSGADVETPYTIFITAKQWRKVAEAMKDAEDQLVVEGYPFLDPDVKGICVFAKMTTTKHMQRDLRQKQRAKAKEQS